MAPIGNAECEVYVLGAAPSKDDVRTKSIFSDQAGRLLRMRLPDGWVKKVRWNNVIRTRPPNDRVPAPEEIESCRPSIIKDIEACKPKIIMGVGPIALRWAAGQSGLLHWSGRRLPIKVGNHTCWFYPMLDPRSIIKGYRQGITPQLKRFGSEDEFKFALDIERLFSDLTDLATPVVHNRAVAEADIELVETYTDSDVARIEKFLLECYDEKVVGFDYETNALRPFKAGAKILTVAISNKQRTLSFPLNHRMSHWTKQQLDRINDAIEAFLYEAPCRKAVHNVAFEMEWSAYHYGNDALRAQPWACTQVQAYVVDERQKKTGGSFGPMALAFATLQYFGFDIKALNVVDRERVDETDLHTVLIYNGVDAKYHRLVYLEQAKRIKRDDLVAVYQEHLRRIPTMVLTQIKGIPIDQAVSQELFRKYYKRRKAEQVKIDALPILTKFKKLKGYDYRPSAPQDITAVVEKILPLSMTAKVLDKNTGKLVQADDKTLKQIAHPIVEATLRWRKHQKVLSTYIEPVMTKCTIDGIDLPGSPFIYPDDLAHPVLQTMRTVTTRTSAADFNNQNWPKRDGERREVRRQIRGPAGTKVVSFDYAGIQARNVAMESKDKALVKAFWDRYDIHSDWTERTVRVYPQWFKEGAKAVAADKAIFKSYRNRAKNEFVFPSFFGAQPKSIARNMGIPLNIVERLHSDFWEAFPDIKGWHDRIMSFYKKYGYVTGLSGYRRRAPISPNELINAPIQADESIIVCTAMSELSELGLMRYQANMMVHDDLTYVWKEKDVEKNAEIVLKHMLFPKFEWAQIVPIGVEMSVGSDWYDQKGVGEYFSDTWTGSLLTRKEV